MHDIVIDEEKCNGCAYCVDVCPVPCLDFDEEEGKPMVINKPGCLVCRTCEEYCAPNAIRIILTE